jgi:hypothetical protein
MWHLEVVSQDRVVYERADVTAVSRDFVVEEEVLTPETRPSGKSEEIVLPGYTVLDNEGKAIEHVSGRDEDCSMKITKEGLLCIEGLWTLGLDIFKTGQESYYHGLQSPRGFITVDRLSRGYEDPELHRQWNLRFEGEGSGLAIASPALAEVEWSPLPAADESRELVHA